MGNLFDTPHDNPSQLRYCIECKKIYKNQKEDDEFNEHKAKTFVFPAAFLQKFKVISKLGQGTFGAVLKLLSIKEKNEYAGKLIMITDELTASEKKIQFIRNLEEAKIMLQIDHPNLIKLYEFFIYEQESILLLCELADGNLTKELTNLDFKKSINYFLQICKGLDYLHNKRKIIHRDLKPENILLKSGTIKICDFGVSKEKFNEIMTVNTIAGTVGYIAPELFDESEKQYFNEKIDIWSLGIIFHKMLSQGVNPFGSKKDYKRNAVNEFYVIDDRISNVRVIEVLRGWYFFFNIIFKISKTLLKL